MLGFKNFRCAQATLKGIELVTMLKKRQQRYSDQSYATPAEQFYALAG
jgi:transposase-like protein